MLAGLVIVFAGPSTALAFALIAIGIALTAILEADKRRHAGSAH
jgi:hypothetical protein